MFRMCKAIDGYDEENTFILTSMRVHAFHAHRSQYPYYEMTTSHDVLRDVLYFNWRLEEVGVPPRGWHSTSVGIPFYPSGFAAIDGRLQLPEPCEVEVGGHCVSLSGWIDEGETLEFINTWGPDWGDSGAGLLTREYIETLMLEAWISYDARFGPTPANNKALVAALNGTDDPTLARIWMSQNERRTAWHQHRRQRVRLAVFETVSLAGRMVEVIEIRDRRGVLIAWAHLHFEAGESKTVRVKEFYVWPAFRRRGFGTLLAELVEERAVGWSKVSVIIHQADVVPRFRRGAELFVRGRGYEWVWTMCDRPVRVAAAEKTL